MFLGTGRSILGTGTSETTARYDLDVVYLDIPPLGIPLYLVIIYLDIFPSGLWRWLDEVGEFGEFLHGAGGRIPTRGSGE